MLNRLMFVYFIQKKGFLDGDMDYLRNRLQMMQQEQGKDKFQTFYRYFLLRLFHDGLGKSPDERKLDATLEKLLGKVPYLNGGFFEVHQLEERNPDIDIPDKAFEKLFDFFDALSAGTWTSARLRADNEINPDVLGYIFEKYINQKQMGAYYTKEDITEYISKNTIIPFLFDAAEKKCADRLQARQRPLAAACATTPTATSTPPSRMACVDDPKGPTSSALPAGDRGRREGCGQARRLEPSPPRTRIALPTETWREHVARRSRCLELREKLEGGRSPHRSTI